MKTLSLALAIVISIAGINTYGQKAQKPNIIIILADDLGWSDLGCYGSEIHTPNLDSLAKNGLRFTQFYNSARCCPSRASLLTGLYPHQAGVGAMTEDRGPAHPAYRGTLLPDTVTIAEALKSVGYKTYMVGKWHLHNKQDVKPTDRGFDEFYGMLGGFNSFWHEKPYYTRLPADRPVRPHTSPKDGQPGSFYSTDAFADYALDFISQARNENKPFFLYLAFNAPHFPLHAYPEDIAKYEQMYFEKGWDVIRAERLERLKQLGLVPKDLQLTPRSIVPPKLHAIPSPFAGKENPAWSSLPEERRRDLARRMAVYAAMIDRMDKAIGRVIDDLKKHNQFEKTFIMFLSDNGACWEWDPYGFDGSSSPNNILHKGEDLKKVGMPDSYISYGSGWANACNTPWRFYKHFTHEGGIRTPLIIHWQAGIPARGELRTQQGHIIDIMPTILEIAGAKYPAQRNGIKVKPLEGVSLVPTFKNKKLTRKNPLFFEHEGSRAVIDGKWKLVSLSGDKWEPYDLQKDPAEMNNLIQKEPAIARRLIEQWNNWATRCHVDTNVNLLKFASVNTPQIANRPLHISCDVETQSTDGVILAQGGNQNGYAIHLENGYPVFSVRINGTVFAIKSAEKSGKRFSISAELKENGAMSLSINGKEIATGKASGLIPVQLIDELSTGEDSRSAVGNYKPPFPLNGKIENVKIITK